MQSAGGLSNISCIKEIDFSALSIYLYFTNSLFRFGKFSSNRFNSLFYLSKFQEQTMAPRLPLSLLFYKHCISRKEICCKHCGQVHTEKLKLCHEFNRNTVRYRHCAYPTRSFFTHLLSKNVNLSNKEEQNKIKVENM